jgi:hypothetical protein
MCRSKAEGGRRCNGARGRRSLPAVINLDGSASLGSFGGSASLGSSGLARRSRAAVLRDAQKQLNDLLDALVDAAPVGSAVTLASAVDTDAADQIADAITASLEGHGCPRGKWQSHLLCGALAAAAHAMKAGEDLVKSAITDGVVGALTSAGVPRLAARLAARAAVNAVMQLAPVRHWEDVRRGVELLAVSTCPDVVEHAAVEQYCLRPLASKFLSDSIQEELATLPGTEPQAGPRASAVKP